MGSPASRRKSPGRNSACGARNSPTIHSKPRQFYRSQSGPEQSHIKDAFVFELSKCKSPAIRVRMVSHLTNVDEELAKKVADALVTAAKEEDAMVELVAPKVGVTDSDPRWSSSGPPLISTRT